MRFLSLFSGVEAASLAFLPLGWECVAVAEIEKFPCQVLKHHYPGIPNLGDVTKITEQQIKDLAHIDVVIFGFPCQDLSVAGQRKGLKHADGTHTRSGLFHHAERIATWSKARWAIAENVPGLFSSNAGRDFATVVGELAGCNLDVPGDGWMSSGMALGKKGLVEWFVLDAQWRGLAQRRKRVFFVRDTGNWADRPPFFPLTESLLRNPAPRREKGKEVAGTFGARTKAGGGFGTDFDLGGGQTAAELATVDAQNKTDRGDSQHAARRVVQHEPIPIQHPCTGLSGKDMDKKGCGIGNFGEPAFTVRSGQVDGVAVMEPIPINMQSAIKNGTKSPNGNGIGEPGDPACTLGANDRHAVGVPMTCATLTKNYATHHGRTAGNNGGIAEGQLIPETAVTLRSGPTTKVAHSARSGDKDENLVVHSLRGDGFDASEDGTGRGTPIVIAHGQGNAEQVSDGSPSLTCNHEAPICFEPRMVRTTGGQPQSDLNHTLRADNNSGDGQPCVQHGMAVRRLTPRECERLQGFLDDYTKIPSAFVLKLGIEPDPNNPKHWAADGPRYKAIGNSFAVPCVRWIGERIEAIEKLKP